MTEKVLIFCIDLLFIFFLCMRRLSPLIVW